MSLGKNEFTAFFKTFFVIIGSEGPTANENKFLNDFANQFMLKYYTSIQAISNAIIDMDYYDMIRIVNAFSEVEKDMVRIYWAKYLKCHENMPRDYQFNTMFIIAEDTGIDMSDFDKYIS